MKNLEIPGGELAGFCGRWKIVEFSLFGSVLRGDFRPESDIDVIVSFADGADWSLLDHIQMEMELGNLLGRKVDVLTRRSVENSGNAIRREEILTTARLIYAAP